MILFVMDIEFRAEKFKKQLIPKQLLLFSIFCKLYFWLKTNANNYRLILMFNTMFVSQGAINH